MAGLAAVIRDEQRRMATVFLILLPVLAAVNPVQALDINTEQVEKDHELETIRSQIKDVKSSIRKAKKDVEAFFRQLQTNESATAKVAEKIQYYKQQIVKKNQQLAKLHKDKAVQETRLTVQRRNLARQIRAAYKTGRNNYLKLLLNQEDPDRIGRMLTYYNYDTRARSKRIAGINNALSAIASLEQGIQTQRQQLSQLQQQEESRLVEFRNYRASRRQITTKLQAYIADQGVQLQILQNNEGELAKLVGGLKQQELVMQRYEEMPPFNSLQGKLSWPVRGRIISRFGNLRKGGKLKWQGVTIAAKDGVEVKAIAAGKVVFADWFRNMGLLVIIDHGDGFMSLYGHNQRLLKKSGDWVLAGDLIAFVGDTGGQHQPGLYFEIRQSGYPINPNLWCRN